MRGRERGWTKERFLSSIQRGKSGMKPRTASIARTLSIWKRCATSSSRNCFLYSGRTQSRTSQKTLFRVFVTNRAMKKPLDRSAHIYASPNLHAQSTIRIHLTTFLKPFWKIKYCTIRNICFEFPGCAYYGKKRMTPWKSCSHRTSQSATQEDLRRIWIERNTLHH